jgi:hypothetical protein
LFEDMGLDAPLPDVPSQFDLRRRVSGNERFWTEFKSSRPNPCFAQIAQTGDWRQDFELFVAPAALLIRETESSSMYWRDEL